MKRSKLFLMVFTLGIGLTACSEQGDLVAKVNGKKIFQDTFNAYLMHKRVPVDNESLKNKELDAYLAREGLAEVILAQDVLDRERVEVEVNEFRKQMIISRYMEKYLAEKVNEQAVRNFYAANSERYKSKRAHVAHILIRTTAKMSEQEKSALLTKAQEVYSRAMANEDFSKLAKEYSEDKLSAKKGGDLGWIQQGAIDPVFSKTAFALEPETVSQPIATPFGFHVVKLLEGPDEITRPYEKVKGDIRYELRQQAKLAEMERLKSLVKIEK